ncbi:MAG: cytochrome c3 family protein [Acidobacteriaceae bacterium]
MRIPLGWRRWLLLIAAAAGACLLVRIALPHRGIRAAEQPAYVTSGVFTPAHPDAYAAIKDFLDIHPEHPVQPIAYTHKVHLAKGLPCTFCHVGVDQGPEARIPGVNVCMSCHQSIATDRPEIKKIAAYKARGEEIPWVRVYNYSESAHVRFNHAPHIRAGVDCASCHSDLTQQTTAERKVNLNMGFCLNCHTQKKVSVDCETCHY